MKQAVMLTAALFRSAPRRWAGAVSDWDLIAQNSIVVVAEVSRGPLSTWARPCRHLRRGGRRSGGYILPCLLSSPALWTRPPPRRRTGAGRSLPGQQVDLDAAHAASLAAIPTAPKLDNCRRRQVGTDS